MKSNRILFVIALLLLGIIAGTLIARYAPTNTEQTLNENIKAEETQKKEMVSSGELRVYVNEPTKNDDQR